MLLKTAVAERLRELLKEKGITQYQLFKITGVPQSTISTIMSEKDKTCKLNTILLLAEGLSITASEFFNSPVFDFGELNLD
ncbi:MAG: helix-turn-helix transcriptional regulator [Clostridia bacterium]